MKLALRQSGGVAGLVRAITTDDLSPPDRAKALQLLEQSGIKSAFEQTSPQARDAQRYELTVWEDSHSYRVVIDDTTLPETLEPLIEFLSERARPVKR